MDWQPIETAPKSSKVWILACQRGCKWAVVMRYLPAHREWQTWDNKTVDDGWNPTHWMPLPEPPQ